MPAQPEVLAAAAAVIDAVDDTGKILTRERFVSSDLEFINLFRNLNGNIGHGWLISYVGFTQVRGDRQCEIVRTLKYALEAFYPYNDKQGDSTSHAKFREMIEAVSAAFNAQSAWDLGLGNLVQHNLLQTVEDFVVRLWGEGDDARLTHYGVFELFVEVTITV